MSEVTPPPQPPGLPPTPTAGQLKVAVANPPEAMARQLALGAKLDAVITGAAPKGQFQIDTAFGRVVIQTNLPLPLEGSLQLQLLAKGGILQFLITSIHGMPPQAALRAFARLPAAPGKGDAQAKPPPGGTAAQPGVPAGAVTRLPPTVNLTVGATLAATLLKGPAPAGATSPAPGAPGNPPAISQALSQAGAATGQGQAPATPAPGAQVKTGQAAAGVNRGGPGGGAGKGQATAQGTQASPTQGAPAAQAGTGGLFSVRITAFQAMTAGAAAGSAGAGALPAPPAGGILAPGGTLSGIATGATSATGHPIVLTHAGPLVLATRTPLPPGSTVTFEVLSQTPSPAGTTEAPSTHGIRPQTIMTERWPALREAVTTLNAVNPAAAQQLINAVLPQPGAALGNNILFFLMALSGGDLHGWFGDGPIRALKRAKPELLTRLRDDFRQIERIAREPGEWRTTLIPFFNGAEIDPIRLSLRNGAEDDADDGSDNAKGTRFIIDLDLSRLGRFQLDGLVHHGEKRMDLIVRTDDALPRPIENGIRGIFQDAADVTGIKGGISFQAAPPNFIEVLGSEPADETLGLIV